LILSLIFGVKSKGPILFGLSALLLILFALAASYITASMSVRVDSMVALRYE
jgi:hypothetical protein